MKLLSFEAPQQQFSSRRGLQGLRLMIGGGTDGHGSRGGSLEMLRAMLPVSTWNPPPLRRHLVSSTMSSGRLPDVFAQLAAGCYLLHLHRPV